MQGGVWGGLKCTTTMDKLCKVVYKDDNLLYKYRNTVSVPPLEMRDDVVTASKCGATSVALNSTVNTFMDLKKLKLSADKCSKIHIGNKATKETCPEHKVHQENMKNTKKEKYLGDFITEKANSKETIKHRTIRGNAVLSQMTSLLNDIPLGRKRIEMGLTLRKAWFLNGCLFNSEVWCGYNHNDLNDLEVLDHKILKLIIGAQAKVPTEMLYLETSEIPIQHVISVRRLMYYQTILKRHNVELTKKIYLAMKDKPFKNDWIELIEEDLEKINLSLKDEDDIKKLSKEDFKEIIKKAVREITFKEMEAIKSKHNKVKNIQHTHMKSPQGYMKSPKFTNKLVSTLFNLRCRSENEFKQNFPNGHMQYLCIMCKSEVDTQEHALTCQEITQRLSVEDKLLSYDINYSDLFGQLDSQLKITKLFTSIIKLRQKFREKSHLEQAHHGLNSGPSG